MRRSIATSLHMTEMQQIYCFLDIVLVTNLNYQQSEISHNHK